MSRQVIFMFPGQGTQYFQMGRELFAGNIRFRHWMETCGEIARPYLDATLTGILYGDRTKSEPFNDIRRTNPCLFCIEYSMAQVLMEEGLAPDALLGYSLGEIVAASVSGAISLEDGIRLVSEIARLAVAKAGEARMLAVFDPDHAAGNWSEMAEDCWVTARNFPGNTVLCGKPAAIAAVKAVLEKKSISHQMLPVTYGFHTELIDGMRADLRSFTDGLEKSAPRTPILSSSHGGMVTSVDGEYCWNAIRHPIDFQATVLRTARRTAAKFIDVGPSGSLATFVKYLLPAGSGSFSLETMNPFGRDLATLKRVLAHVHSESQGAVPKW